MLVVLLVVILAVAAMGVALLMDMLRRDQPFLGMIDLMIIQGDGVLAAVYAAVS
jgi:hypothetical protein